MKAVFRELVVAAILLLIANVSAPGGDRAVVLRVGTASRLLLDRSFETVLVGDPHIVNVRTDDDRSVLVEPLNPGATNLVFIDARGIVIDNIRVSVCGAPAAGGCDAAASAGNADQRFTPQPHGPDRARLG
jgi:Flp pilus assembly secretin CpaC